MITDPLRDLLAARDPSLALAVAALLRRAGDDGAVSFGDLAVAYCEDYLDLRRQAFGERLPEGGVLSIDQVRGHLTASVLPRLVTDGLLEPLPETVEYDTPVKLRPEHWARIAPTLGEARRDVFARALEAVQAAESSGAATAAPGAGSVLAARGLTKVYQRRKVVDDVHLELRQGEIVGLLGPNGAGKTTTFYMIVGMVRPDAGRIFLDGQDISALPMYRRARRGIGYLAQEPSVFRKLTVEENVLAILETLNIGDNERRERLEQLLDELSLTHLRTARAYTLSGGERRRLEITRALVTQPRFLLLDEPFTGVDPIAVHDIQTIVARLRRRGIGVLITDHNVEQTLDIVDRASIVFEGKLQVAGTVRDLVFDDRVADLYLGPTLTARLRARLGAAA
jgi:lipopolysaccharide export system ATP-binding protein